MGFFFDVSQYAHVPQAGGWDTLNAAINAIRQKRHQEDQQRKMLAATAQQNALQRQAVAENNRIAEENERQRIVSTRAREDVRAASTAAGQAMLAEQRGAPGEADAIMAAAAPTGATSATRNIFPGRVAPEAAPTNLRMPEMEANRAPAVAPEQAMGQQLRAPMSGAGPQAQLWDMVMKEQGRLSSGDQGRQIGGMAQDVAGFAPPPEAPPDGPSQTVRDFTAGGRTFSVNRDEEARKRALQARAYGAPGALSSNPAAAAAAMKAQQQAEDAARVGPVDEAVKSAIGTRSDELGLLRGDAAAERASARFGMSDDRIIGRAQWDSLKAPIVDEKVSMYTDARAQLEDAIQQAQGGNLSAMGALAMLAARTAQGSAQNLSNRDVDSLGLGASADYLTKAQDFIERRLQGDKTAPPVGVAELIRYSTVALKAKEMQLARRLRASTQQLHGIEWRHPAFQNIAEEYIRRVYDEYVTPEIDAQLQANDAQERPQGGRRSGSVSVSRSRKGPAAPAAPTVAPEAEGWEPVE